MSYRILALTCVAIALSALGGCDSFYRAIGKEKVVPDEFAVVQRAPLAVPPDFSLRPPRLGTARPQEEAPVDQAREAVFRVGDDNKNLPPAAETRSPGEGELLKEAGAGDAPKNIRQLVETEANTQVDKSFVQKLAFWREDDKKLGPTDTVINPVEESERLKNLAAEKDASAPSNAALAAAPTIERSNSSSGGSSWFGWLTNIF